MRSALPCRLVLAASLADACGEGAAPESGHVSVVSAARYTALAIVPVGAALNGIAYWDPAAGMP